LQITPERSVEERAGVRLTRADIAAGLRELGLRAGDRVLVHSSLTAIGDVDGGADAVIDALLDAVGGDGLVAVPTFACKPPFDRRKSATPLGAVADRLWRRPEAARSLHPTHSVAAIGPGAEEFVRDHEKAPTAYGEGTPYHTLVITGGKILLLGVDQDRNTTLHTAEALAGAAYLSDIQATYVDDRGKHVTIPITAMAGPHRDSIGLDRLFREKGVVRIGKIGGAVCRLIEAGPMVETALEALRRDPAATLCENPNCADCVVQRGKIKAARLAQESFTLAAVAGDISDDPGQIARALQGEGISAVELTADEFADIGESLIEKRIEIAAIRAPGDNMDTEELADSLAVPLIVTASAREDFEAALRSAQRGHAWVLIENGGAPSEVYEEFYAGHADAPGLAFNPARFAAAAEKPFLGVFYRGRLRKHVEHFYIEDGDTSGNWTLPGMGNAEVKEIISMLRCRSYAGMMTLRSPLGGVENFRRAAAAFWRLLDNM